MIDWLSFAPWIEHDREVFGGRVAEFRPDGSLAWSTNKFLGVEGSHDQRVMVRTHPQFPGAALQISGNPAKFLQGHNVFGSDDLIGLAEAMTLRICEFLSLDPTPNDLHLLRHGLYELTRVDIAQSYQLGNRNQVRSAIKALEMHGHLSHRGRGSLCKQGTIYWGKNSRRWSLKAYCKADELDAPKHKLPAELSFVAALKAFAENLLRVELTLRRMELRETPGGLHLAANWGENTPSELHAEYLSKLHIAESAMLTATTIEGLPPRLQLAYQAWRDGHDLRQTLPRRTFYRYRRQLLEHGIDIALQQPRTRPDESNVVPLKVVLHARPVDVPAWAIGTPLYFEPRLAA